MKYYKIIENGIITQLHGGSIVPEEQAEISKEEYDTILKVIRNKPEDTLEQVFELKESGVYEGRERTEEEIIQWYIQNNTPIDEIPAEYQEAVKTAKPEEEVIDITQTPEYQAGYDQAVLDLMEV